MWSGVRLVKAVGYWVKHYFESYNMITITSKYMYVPLSQPTAPECTHGRTNPLAHNHHA